MTAHPGTRRDLLAPLAEGEPRLPRLVVHTADGRTELSGATLSNWTAKVCGLLRDELGAVPGDAVSVMLPPGWQTAPILLGAWWAGLTVTAGDDAGAIAAFVGQGRDAAADEVFVVSGHPLGAPSAVVADHQRDFTGAVLPQSDRLGALADPGGEVAAVAAHDRQVSVAALADAADRAAQALRSLTPDAAPRPVLVSVADWSLPDGVAATLLATLIAGGTLVQFPPSWEADRIAAIGRSEHATASLGIILDGLPALPARPPAAIQ